MEMEYIQTVILTERHIEEKYIHIGIKLRKNIYTEEIFTGRYTNKEDTNNIKTI